jgi:hypothetical protein
MLQSTHKTDVSSIFGYAGSVLPRSGSYVTADLYFGTDARFDLLARVLNPSDARVDARMFGPSVECRRRRLWKRSMQSNTSASVATNLPAS